MQTLSYDKQENSKPALRLGVHGMTAAEAGLVRALLWLETEGRDWSFAAEGPCDVLLIDDAVPVREHETARRARSARALLLLGEGAGNEAFLPRPLQAQRLAAVLETLRIRLRTAPSDDAASPSPRYRLRQWPPAQLLRGEPLRLRMASQLSRRYLSASELAQLTGQEAGSSQLFLQLLHGFQLLEPEPPAVRHRRPDRASGPGLRLIDSIRRRLGLVA